MKIILCEDQKILLDGLTTSLSEVEGFEIVACLTDATEILPTLRSVGGDLVLTDVITQNKNNALDVVADALKEFENVKFVAITGFPDITFMEKARKVGVQSFVYKNISTEELVGVIKNTYAGYSVYPGSDKSKDLFLSSLSEIELTILRMYCSGKERTEIADELFMSQSSLKSHISSILQKTGCSSIARVAIYAVSSGLIFAE